MSRSPSPATDQLYEAGVELSDMGSSGQEWQ